MYRLNSKKEDFIVRESGFLKIAKEVIQKDGSDLERIDKNESKPHRYFFRKIGFFFFKRTKTLARSFSGREFKNWKNSFLERKLFWEILNAEENGKPADNNS